MKENFTGLGFLWTNRSVNFVADLVPKLAATRTPPSNWVTSPPRSLAALIDVETVKN